MSDVASDVADLEPTVAEARLIAERVLFQEAAFLDEKEWKSWAELYEERARYWVPSWLDEYDVASDPDTQVSWIYHDSRAQLVERISRIQSRKSITALPLPRTLHLISNMLVDTDRADLTVRSCFTVDVYDPRTYRATKNFGTYKHRLRRSGGRWLIASKTIVLMNDRIPTVLDFYSI